MNTLRIAAILTYCRYVDMPAGYHTVLWHHGTREKNWTDSGWVYHNRFYPCEYTNNVNGQDKLIGQHLIDSEKQSHREYVQAYRTLSDLGRTDNSLFYWS